MTNIGRENNRLEVTSDIWIIKETRRLIKVLEGHLGAVEAQIAALVESCDALAAANRRLRSVTGIGPVVAAILLARLPELGILDHRPLASLAGLAPLASLAGLASHASDSGLHRGRRLIWSGRAEVRRALYIAAKSASQWDPVFKAVKQRLTDAGKPFKVAIIACARKMLTILAAMFRTGQNYKKAPA